ncbi:ABC transporter [Corynebacterium cystitidis DSM 20524]|uniref:ABC transporter n=1 Tax=Corynebacterium cystitidis DSM 20524 TaxID=1121357 RepID=A0A1H9V564_9CORY|nr:ABC transporter [Corynebacterium cystitidis DSM 20524]
MEKCFHRSTPHILRSVQGEVYGLLGTNRAGKTSTLELIEGLARPSGGTVTIMGLDPLNDRHHIRPHLGIMLQSGGLPQQLTVEETMHMWAGLCSNPRPITEVLENVELTHRTDVKVGTLTDQAAGDMRQVVQGYQPLTLQKNLQARFLY